MIRVNVQIADPTVAVATGQRVVSIVGTDLVGPRGAPGPASTVPGPEGPEGPAGADGADGAPGADSTVPGPAGPAGATGAAGADSTVPGPAGATGPAGSAGATGPAGADGNDGAAGAAGDPGPGLAVGGTTGQVAAKLSDTDYDVGWVDPAAGGGSAVVIGQPNMTGGTIIAVPGVAMILVTTEALTANQQRLYPIIVNSPVTVDAMLCEVTTQSTAGGIARLGIYEAGLDWQPGTLIQDAGTVAIDSLGVKTASFAAVDLAAGRYMLALIAGAAATLRGYRGAPLFGRLNETLGAGGLMNSFLKAAVGTGALAADGVNFDALGVASTTIPYHAFLRITAV